MGWRMEGLSFSWGSGDCRRYSNVVGHGFDQGGCQFLICLEAQRMALSGPFQVFLNTKMRKIEDLCELSCQQ